VSVIYSPESGYAKERVKWEAQGSEMGPGLKPYVYQEYPVMMYLAGIPAGEVGAPRIIQHMVIADETQANNMASRGWRNHPLEALKAYDAQKLEEAKLAAEIEYEVKNRLSPNAAAEVRAAQDEHDGHLPSIPETAIRHRLSKTVENVQRIKETKE
jgi:hypothetical protein